MKNSGLQPLRHTMHAADRKPPSYIKAQSQCLLLIFS